MQYTINKLAKLAGVSTRTLRYYDEIGLLVPNRVGSNGYRVYEDKEIDQLQQILFYRELGVPLEEIQRILLAKDFDEFLALQNHLTALLQRRDQINLLINNVEKTIRAMKGEIIMSDQEKFEGFLEKLIKDNEKKYGEEIRRKYGDESVNHSNAKVLNMNPKQYDSLESLTLELNEALKKAVSEGDPSSERAQKACELHKQWLCFYWNEYSKEAHIGVTQMYVDDPRFTAYYDQIAPGCATFLRDAVAIYCK